MRIGAGGAGRRLRDVITDHAESSHGRQLHCCSTGTTANHAVLWARSTGRRGFRLGVEGVCRAGADTTISQRVYRVGCRRPMAG